MVAPKISSLTSTQAMIGTKCGSLTRRVWNDEIQTDCLELSNNWHITSELLVNHKSKDTLIQTSNENKSKIMLWGSALVNIILWEWFIKGFLLTIIAARPLFNSTARFLSLVCSEYLSQPKSREPLRKSPTNALLPVTSCQADKKSRYDRVRFERSRQFFIKQHTASIKQNISTPNTFMGVAFKMA